MRERREREGERQRERREREREKRREPSKKNEGDEVAPIYIYVCNIIKITVLLSINKLEVGG